MHKSIFLGLLLLLLTGCMQPSSSQPLRISANLWVGYMPLFYLKERGWLKENHIELVNVVSLYENMQMYAIGNVDAFTGTQYEYHQLLQKRPQLVPIMLFDRSRGADLVMGNRSIEALRKSSEPIDLYLEVDSVNSELFRAFLKYSGMDEKRFHVINMDPEMIAKLPMHKRPTLIVTYEPFDDPLRQKGYRVLVDTKMPDLGFEIIDALYISKADKKRFAKELQQLNRLVAKALVDLQRDPKTFYEYVKYYLQGKSFDAFQESLKSIEWIYGRRDSALRRILQREALPDTDLLEPVKDAI